MQLLTKEQYVRSCVAKIKNIEDLKKIKINIILKDGHSFGLATDYIRTTSKHPTKKDKIIYECMHLLRKRRPCNEEPATNYNLDLDNIEDITFRCSY